MHATSNGKIVKFGGMTDSRIFLNKIDIFNIGSGVWNSIQPDPRFIFTSNPGIVQISNEIFVIFGGKIGGRN